MAAAGGPNNRDVVAQRGGTGWNHSVARFHGTTHIDFDRRPGWLRALHALAALYLAAALFGLAVGVADLVLLDAPGRRPIAVVLQSVQGVLWGLTFTGYVLLLGPLSYANHALVARAVRRGTA